jgi:hypothetical protein
MPCFGIVWSQVWTMDYNSTILIQAQSKQNGGSTNQRTQQHEKKGVMMVFYFVGCYYAKHILT